MQSDAHLDITLAHDALELNRIVLEADKCMTMGDMTSWFALFEYRKVLIRRIHQIEKSRRPAASEASVDNHL